VILKYSGQPAAPYQYGGYECRLPWTVSLSLSLDFIAGAFMVIVRRGVRVMVIPATGLIAIAAIFELVPTTYDTGARVFIVAASNRRGPSVRSVDLPAVAAGIAVLTCALPRRLLNKLNLSVDLIAVKRKARARVDTRSLTMEIDREKLTDHAVAGPNSIADELATYYANPNRTDDVSAVVCRLSDSAAQLCAAPMGAVRADTLGRAV
jgi:hypothetical protein